MKKVLYIFTVLFVFFYIPNVYAYCDPKETVNLNKIAGNVTYTYDLEENGNDVKFKVTLLNAKEYIYFNLENNNRNYYYEYSPDIVLGSFLPNNTLKVAIYSTNSVFYGCDNMHLKTLYINLPNYNSFYKDPLCEGIESYQLCQKWITTSMTYESFKKKVTEYRKSLEKPIEEPIEEPDIFSILDKIVDFLFQHYTTILIAIVVLGTGGIIYLKSKEKSKKKFSL